MKLRVAFSGSGFLAPIHAGVVCAMLDKGHEIVEVAGTSGGSIVAAMIAAGFSSDKIKTIALQDLPDGIVSPQISGLWSLGLNDGHILQRWLRETFGGVTFASAKVPITIMATDIDHGIPYRLAKDVAAGTFLADACRASASVPFVYEPFILNGVKCVDGGVCCNLPLDKLVMDDAQQIGVEVMDGSSAGSTGNIFSFGRQCIKAMLSSNEGNLVAWGEMYDAKIIQADASPYGFLDASLTAAQKLDLFNRGYTAFTKTII